MTARGTPDQALTSFRNARILWADIMRAEKPLNNR